MPLLPVPSTVGEWMLMAVFDAKRVSINPSAFCRNTISWKELVCIIGAGPGWGASRLLGRYWAREHMRRSGW